MELESNPSSILKFYKDIKDDYSQKWQSILEEDNITALRTEMSNTLVKVSCFVTNIENQFQLIKVQCEMKKEYEKTLKEYQCVGRELLTKLKLLAILEKATAMEKYEQPHVRKMSYAATEETGSGVDTESMIGGYGGFSKEDSLDRKDSCVITLSHHYAASFTKRYEIFSRLNHNVEEIIDRLNNLLDLISLHLQTKFASYQNVSSVGETAKQSYALQPVFYKKEETTGENEVTIEVNLDSKSAVEILYGYLDGTDLVPMFRHTNISGSGHLIEHTYCCSLMGIYVEGKNRKKSKAKEDAAIQMLKELVKKQKMKMLPSQIPLFSDYELHELTSRLEEKEDLIDKLEEVCLNLHEQPPLYTVLSETGKNNEPDFTIKCEAAGYTAVGYANKKPQAKKNAAKSILNLITKRRKSQVTFQ